MALLNFTDKDLKILREVIEAKKKDRQNPGIARSSGDLGTQSPEHYIAYPTGDIPALTQASGTGTGKGY